LESWIAATGKKRAFQLYRCSSISAGVMGLLSASK
jgi:hypothetical protein